MGVFEEIDEAPFWMPPAATLELQGTRGQHSYKSQLMITPGPGFSLSLPHLRGVDSLLPTDRDFMVHLAAQSFKSRATIHTRPLFLDFPTGEQVLPLPSCSLSLAQSNPPFWWDTPAGKQRPVSLSPPSSHYGDDSPPSSPPAGDSLIIFAR